MQLQQIVASLPRQHGVQPLLLCHGQNSSASEAAGFKPFEIGLQKAESQTHPIVWLSNDSWLAGSQEELRTTLGYLANVPGKSAHMQGHGTHYLVMQYGPANAPHTIEEVQAEFSRMSSSSFRVTGVQTTVQPDADSSYLSLPYSVLAENSALPYMLVRFEVGTTPAETAGRNFESSSTQSDQIDPTGDSPTAEASGQQQGNPKRTPTKRPAEYTAGPAATKKHASPSAKTAAASIKPQNVSSAFAALALGHQEPMPGGHSYNQHIPCLMYMHHFAWQGRCTEP